MRMIPILPPRFVGRDFDFVAELLNRIDKGMDNFIAMALWRRIEAVKMHVDRSWSHKGAATLRLAIRNEFSRRARNRRNLIGQFDVDRVAGIDVESRRFRAVWRRKAE